MTLRKDGHDLLIAGPELQVWRAPTDNDGIKGHNDSWRILAKWREQGLDRAEIVAAPIAGLRTNRDGTVSFVLEHTVRCAASPKAVVLRHAYTLSPDGTLTVENVFIVQKVVPDLPRLGVVMRLPAGFEKLQWFGRGPYENYSDRKRSAMVDLHTSTVTDEYVPTSCRRNMATTPMSAGFRWPTRTARPSASAPRGRSSFRRAISLRRTSRPRCTPMISSRARRRSSTSTSPSADSERARAGRIRCRIT